MTEGISTYNGLALPLYGESEIQQQTIGYDILTITSAASNTSDFLVLQTSTGSELLRVEDDGRIFQSITGSSAAGSGNIASYRVINADAGTGMAYTCQFLLDEATNEASVASGRHCTLYLRFMNNSCVSLPQSKSFIHFDDNATASTTLFTFGNAVTDAGYFVTTNQSATRGLVTYINGVKYYILLGATS